MLARRHWGKLFGSDLMNGMPMVLEPFLLQLLTVTEEPAGVEGWVVSQVTEEKLRKCVRTLLEG